MRKKFSLLSVSLVAIALTGGGWPPLASSQMGQMGGQAQGPMGQAAEPTEHGTKTVDGLAITLLTAPPLSQQQMGKMMPGMGEMKGPMGGMQQMPPMGPMKKGMRPMQGMSAMETPTHWIGVIVRDATTDAAVKNAPITLTARKGQWIRTVDLMPMPGSYGANISLPDKGKYEITVKVTRPAPGQHVEARYDFTFR